MKQPTISKMQALVLWAKFLSSSKVRKVSFGISPAPVYSYYRLVLNDDYYISLCTETIFGKEEEIKESDVNTLCTPFGTHKLTSSEAYECRHAFISKPPISKELSYTDLLQEL